MAFSFFWLNPNLPILHTYGVEFLQIKIILCILKQRQSGIFSG